MMTTRAWLGGTAALALLATGAAAQDFCGGASANGQWIGGAEGSSDVTAAAAPMEQMALVLMQNEYVALFSVSAPTDVRLEAQGRGSGDPLIELRDESGAVIASDDDSGGGGAARAETALQPGRYCLSVRSFDGSPLTGFVRVGRTDQEALTQGSGATPAPAPEPSPSPEPTPAPTPTDPNSNGICEPALIDRMIGPGGSIDSALAAGGASGTATATEVDTWGFSLDAPASVSITAENVDADPLITLYDEFGNYLSENDDFDGLNSRIDMTTPLAAGTYCVAMQALSNAGLPITVTVTGYDAAAAQAGMYDRAEAAPPLDGSYPVAGLGTLGTRLRQDATVGSTATWYSFDVTEGGVVVVEAVTNGQGDPTLTLFDDFGRQVAYNDDNGDSLDSLLVARVQPGTYLLAVRQLNDGQSALTRMLFERYVPAR